MKKYNLLLIIYSSIIVICSASMGVFIVYKQYWMIIISLYILMITILRLNKLHKQAVTDITKLIDAIKFLEFNVLFKYGNKNIFPDLTAKMKDIISLFNKKMQEKEAEFNLYENLLKKIDTAILVVNSSNIIQWINKPALDILGKSYPHKLTDLAYLSPDLPYVLEKLLPKEVKTIKITTASSESLLAATVVLFFSKGEKMRLISLKNIQSALDENESEAWKKLIRILTHEMMNSLTPIISLSETFSDDETTDCAMMGKAMKTIHRRSKNLVQFVANYQKLTRIPAPVLSVLQIEEIMEDISSLLKAQNIKFQYTIFPNNITLNADKGQMEQVLINLIKNAWEACCHLQTPDVRVDIRTDEYQRILISVSDNGHGILKEVTDKIFIPFFTTKKDGSGIGLSICRQIISAHGGTISVSSEPDKGATFLIRM